MLDESAVVVDRTIVGWDIGGAHVKAALLRNGRLKSVRQWPCALWQGMHLLDAVIDEAFAAWPAALPDSAGGVRHAVTMTGEMVDLFDNRKDGVMRLAAHLGRRLGPSLHLFAGSGEWLTVEEASNRWAEMASANWAATGKLVATRWAARSAGEAEDRLAGRAEQVMLVDIGSTTSDIIALRCAGIEADSAAAPPTATPGAGSDAQRLRSGELLYHGVVRTPLCALARRIAFRGQHYNVMNEFFATTADVYRLTGELDPAHDQHPAADGGSKDLGGASRRIARMIGHDAADAGLEDWQRFAQEWRSRQLAILQAELRRVEEQPPHPLQPPHSPAPTDPPLAPPMLVGAGCGSFLVRALAQRMRRDYVAFHELIDAPAPLQRWVDVCAPAVAVALLLERQGSQAGSSAP
jgi:probable H4MPT-linked C1 transfer pathway protein